MKQKNKIVFKSLLGEATHIWEKYHRKTKRIKLDNTPSSEWPEEWKKVYYKAYSRFPEIILPSPVAPKNKLHKVLVTRVSSREFSKKKLLLSEISNLLHFSAGVNGKVEKNISKRFYPSGGARYPLELYLLSLNTELPKGIFHYYVKKNSLELLKNFNSINLRKFFNYDITKNASCILIITAVFPRNTIKYGEHGYKLSLLEAGHLGQNIYLSAADQNIKCCAMYGFIDDNLNELIGVDGVHEAALYCIALGK